jgi:DNA-binding CsgD family transcriptional regulator
MRLREHSRSAPVRSRTAEARSLADRLHEWLESEDKAPLIVRRSDGSAVAVHLMRPDEPDAQAEEAVGEMLSLATLRALGLTRREAEVMRLVAQGKTNQQIAARITVSIRTVQKHLENVYEKLGARSRTQAVLTAWSIGRACGWSPGR